MLGEGVGVVQQRRGGGARDAGVVTVEPAHIVVGEVFLDGGQLALAEDLDWMGRKEGSLRESGVSANQG